VAIFELFSKRQNRLNGNVPDVYSYNSLAENLRVQIIHIWSDSLGNENSYHYHEDVRRAYALIVDTLHREYGAFQLPGTNRFAATDHLEELTNYFLQEEDIQKQLDVVELSFKVIHQFTRTYQYRLFRNASEVADNAIEELNNRFKECGIGYQFVENEIIRIDSELIHVEAVKPALRLLNEEHYQGAQQEFLSAYEHYRQGKNKEALNDCLKSFESTMKAICDKQQWIYQPNATAKILIQICFDNNLIPSFWQNQFSSLRSMLESSIPTGRNKLSGHGQGSIPTSVPDYLVSYMLHMTASTLVFLITAEKDLPE
jgi:hypothetical protein